MWDADTEDIDRVDRSVKLSWMQWLLELIFFNISWSNIDISRARYYALDRCILERQRIHKLLIIKVQITQFWIRLKMLEGSFQKELIFIFIWYNMDNADTIFFVTILEIIGTNHDQRDIQFHDSNGFGIFGIKNSDTCCQYEENKWSNFIKLQTSQCKMFCSIESISILI